MLFFLPDSPVNARMLSKREKIAALERVRDDQVGTENKLLKKEQVYTFLACFLKMSEISFFCRFGKPLPTFALG